MHTRKKQSGFTMIEILIVVAVILIIAAIAIPKLLAAKTAANEADAAGALKNFMTNQVAYQGAYGAFSASLPQLGPATAGSTAQGTSAFANLVDWSFANALVGGANVKNGYLYQITVDVPNNPATANDSGAGNLAANFTIDAVPSVPGSTGNKFFCMTESGVIHVNPLRGSAGAASGGASTCSAWPAQ